jgi:hypothetical protein
MRGDAHPNADIFDTQWSYGLVSNLVAAAMKLILEEQ